MARSPREAPLGGAAQDVWSSSRRRIRGLERRTDMFLWMLVAVAVLAIPLSGGRIANLARLRLRAVWTIVVAVTIQLVIITIYPDGDSPLHAVAHLVSYGFAAVFVVANRQLPGMWVAASGAALNLLVIGINGGIMPARAEALRSAGIQIVATEFENSRFIADARLGDLGDVFAWPQPMPFPNVFSVGDLILVFGVAVILHSQSGSRLIPRRLRDRDQPPLQQDDERPPPARSGRPGERPGER